MPSFTGNFSIEPVCAHVRLFVHDLQAAGAILVAGTDANAAPGVPASVPHGTGLHEELGLLVDAGLSPLEALRTATSTATIFGWADRGGVRPGLRADLVLVEGDPGDTIAATRKVGAVWVGGHPVKL